jgi:DNA-binding XRE family transcriptional regulator
VRLDVQTSDHDPISVAGVPYRSTRPETIERRRQVAERIRSLRLRRNLSQQRLGEWYGVDRRTVIEMESGQVGITLDTLLDVADALGVPVAWLLADDRSHSDEGIDGGGESPADPP